MEIDWDDRKAELNKARHGVSFEEAATVLLDPYAITDFDVGHSKNEDRWRTIGMSYKLRVLVVIATEREGDLLRIISARKANRSEEAQYEKASRQNRSR